MSSQAEIHVAVGVIENNAGEVLIAYRPPHLHQGGLWEFPGGKVEPGETVQQALERELSEELGIAVVAASPMMKVRHRYADRQVVLDVWRVRHFTGEPSGIAGQPIRWVAPEDLPCYQFPLANRPIIAATRLPDAYAILDDVLGDADVLFGTLQQLIGRGLRLIQLRARKLTAERYREFARDAAHHCRLHGVALLLNAEPELVMQVGAAGVHLNSSRLMALKRRPLAERLWVAASCHNLQQLRQAERRGIDFVVLSPVLATPSHPDATVLGWSHFGRLVAQTNLPVFALGGMKSTDVPEAKRYGAQGIAAIRGFCVQ